MSYVNPSANLPTKYGDFRIVVWPDKQDKEAVAMITPNLDVTQPVTVRVHSECLTGDVFGSLKCDCGQQKQVSLEVISKSKNGVFIYLKQEGRGIGLSEKIRSYALQEQGYDTHEANIILGHEPDPREYTMVKTMLDQLEVKEIKLITNNPSKEAALREFGFIVTERIALNIPSNSHNKKYLETKKVKFKHFDNGSNYYYHGVTGVSSVDEVKEITAYLAKQKLDPFLRVGIGISVDNTVLGDSKQQQNSKNLFDAIMKHSPLLVPVLHYSFKHSKVKDYKTELMEVQKLLPMFKHIQLNDIEKNHIDMLTVAVKYYAVFFPVNDQNVYLVSDPKYAKLTKDNKVLTLLDNSGGRGQQETKASFEKKISMCLNNGINDIGIAGGFGPDNVMLYHQLKKYFKINFSIDAESKLREQGTLSINRVKKYLKQLSKPTNK